jgi:hypothetical protein
MIRNLMMIAGLTLAVSAFGCSDDATNNGGAGGDGGTGGSAGEGGAGGSAGEGGAGGAPGVTDACTNGTDLPLVCDAGFSTTLEACAQAATGSGAATAECLETDPGLSTDCASCFGDDIDCLVANCVAGGECFPDNTTQICADCRADNCAPALDACTGDLATGCAG